MVAQAFGDEHTRRKLETVEKYLAAYTTALKLQKFELLYVDCCAGSGASIPRSALAGRESAENGQTHLLGEQANMIDADHIIVGSALRALKVSPPFDRYLLNDMKQANVAALQAAVKTDFAHLADRVDITKFDANQILLRLCEQTNWKRTRAVVFIDPFGLQIKFPTLQALARTEAIDLWYLVPVFAMYRQVRHDGGVLEDGGRSVDEALGTTEWRQVVAVEEKGQMDLWGASPPVSRRAVDVKWFETVAKDRLKVAFQGRVVDQVAPFGATLHVVGRDRARLEASLADFARQEIGRAHV